MSIKCIRLLVLVLVCSLLSGCFGSRETDELAYVLAMGIDKGKKDRVMVTFQMANPKSAAGGGGGGNGGGEKPFIVASVEGPTTYACLNLMNTVTSRRISLMHCKALIYGEELAHEDISKYVLPQIRFRDIRRTAFINIAEGSAKDYLHKMNPMLESNPSKYYELRSVAEEETGLTDQMKLIDFYEDMSSTTMDPVASLVGVVEKGKNKEEKEANEPESYGAYLPGEIPREGEQPVSSIGTAVFRKIKMVGKLNGDETKTLLMLRGQFPEGYFAMRDPKKPETLISLEMTQGKVPEVDIDLKNNHIKQTIFLEGEIVNIESGEEHEGLALKAELEAQVSSMLQSKCEDLVHKLQKELKVDPVYGKYVRSQFLTLDELRKAKWLTKIYPEIAIEIDVKVKIRRTGLMLKTVPFPETNAPEEE